MDRRMTKPFETITLPLLQHVTGGAHAQTAAATSSNGLPQQGGQSTSAGGPGSGGYMSRSGGSGR
jgi:hypothetical protein